MIIICAISRSSMPQYISTTVVKKKNTEESRYHLMQQHIPEENLAIIDIRGERVVKQWNSRDQNTTFQPFRSNHETSIG